MKLTKIPQPKRGYITFKLNKSLEEKTQAGLIIPSSITEENLFLEAMVTSVGGDTENYKMQTSVGETIIVKSAFVKMTDLTFKIGNTPHFFAREESDFFGWVTK